MSFCADQQCDDGRELRKTQQRIVDGKQYILLGFRVKATMMDERDGGSIELASQGMGL